MKKNLLYVVPPSKSFAGIERVIDTIGSELVKKYSENYEVFILYANKFEEIDKDSCSYKVIQGNISRLRELPGLLRRTLVNGDYSLVIVPQIEPVVFCWIGAIGLKSNIVLYLHGNPKVEGRSFKSRILFFIFRYLIYTKLKAVFGVAPSQISYFRKAFGSKIETFWLPNPVRNLNKDSIVNLSNIRPITFVSVGRLSAQKGQDILIKAFALCYNERKDINLRLVGFGDEKNNLMNLIKMYNLKSSISIEYFPTDPSVVLSNSDIYVSSSRWEGWSIAICEALLFGLPVIATDCEFGPSDILIDHKLGRLVKNHSVTELSEVMLDYCENLTQERDNAKFRKDYIKKFNIDNVISQHHKALFYLLKDS